MTKRCELTGVSPLKGHNVSHAKNKTKRRFLPNLKKVTFKSDILNKNIKLNVANAALRTVDFKGGLDKFLKTAKNANLSNKVLFSGRGETFQIWEPTLFEKFKAKAKKKSNINRASLKWEKQFNN